MPKDAIQRCQMSDRTGNSALNLALKETREFLLRISAECQRSQTKDKPLPKNIFTPGLRLILDAKLGGVVLTGDEAVVFSDLLSRLHEVIRSGEHEISLAEVESAVREAL